MQNEELHNLYTSPNIVRVNKSMMMRWVRHVARVGKGKVVPVRHEGVLGEWMYSSTHSGLGSRWR